MSPPATSYRRDLELVMLGVALSKSERDRVTAALPSQAWSRELGPLVQSLSSKSQALVNWLDVRGVTLSKGNDGIGAIIAKIVEDNERERIKTMVSALSMAAGIQDIEELKQQMTAILKQIETTK